MMNNSQKRNRTHRPNTTSNRVPNKARGYEKNVIDLKKLHSAFCSDDLSDRPIKMQPSDSGNIVLMIKPEDFVEVIRTESRMGFLQILHATEGIFSNPRYTHTATSLVGCCVQVQVKNGKCYEGILKTYSPKMDVVLEMAHKVDDTGNNNIPSRDLVHEKIIFTCADILMLTATDVDLDYAVKDTFTDSAISKQNGVVEKEQFRELTPWEPEEHEAHAGAGLHDGGASNGWDPNEMFSTNERQFNVKSTYDDSLHQYTTPLEKRDTKEYREKEERAAQLAQEIEKSDGYRQRIDLENSTEADDEEAKFSAVVRPDVTTAALNPGKYVPPGKRNQFNQQRNRNVPQNNNTSVRMPVHQPPPQPTAPRLAAQQSREEVKVNGNEVKEEVKVEDKDVSSPELASAGPEPTHTSPVSKQDRKNSSNPKDREVLVQELKDFSTNFKLDDSKESKKSPEKVEKVEQKEDKIEKTKSPPPVVVPPPQKEDSPRQKKEETEASKKSDLNPLAKPFQLNANAKPFQPAAKAYPQQVPTPPRPQTQSPIIQPMPPAMPHQQMYPQLIFQTNPLSQQIPQQRPPKRENGNKRPPPTSAVVSIQPPPQQRPDFTAAAAQAATGAPLLAHTPYSTVPYTSFMMPQPASYQVGQVMPMPSATPAAGHRMMTPPSGATMDMNQQPTGPTMYMGPNGPVPAHIPHQTYPQPAHIGPHHGQQNQQNHPAPSPVQHVVTSSQSHPPTSNTPQPHNPYQQMQIQGHPPLQPSPVNPASPQTVHMPAVQYHFGSHQLQMQAGNNQMGHPPTSAANALYSQHMQQFVMMPHPQHQHNQQSHQFQHHIGPGMNMMPQGAQTAIQNTQPGAHPQFIPQVPSQGAPPSIQNFQQNH